MDRYLEAILFIYERKGDDMTLADIELDAILMKTAQKKERDIWEEAIRSVRCMLPDDAEDVELEAQRIRNRRLAGLPVIGSTEEERWKWEARDGN